MESDERSSMYRYLIRYFNGTEEWLTDSEPGLATLEVGERYYGGTVIAREEITAENRNLSAAW